MEKAIKSIIITTLISGGLLQNGFAARKKASSANGQYICPTCQQSFTTKGGLKSHIKAVHDKIKDQKCPYCGKQFSQKCNLNKHIEIVHEKIKDHECPHCNKQFSYKQALNKHIKNKHSTMEQDHNHRSYAVTF